MGHHDLPWIVLGYKSQMVFLVFLMLSSLKNTKSSKKHNRHLGNERHGSIRLFGIMSNKRPGGNMLNLRLVE